jgi:cell volume regulation protein A
VGLKGRLKPLLELESGSNDPMAVFLTATMIQVVQQPDLSLGGLLLQLPVQMALGAVLGYLLGRAIPVVVNHLSLGFDGLYPVLTLASVLLTYGLTVWIGGNGFLAVYIAGIVAGNHDFVHKWSLLRFHDGLAWLMQIAMFITLGLLVFPSRLLPSAGIGLVVTLILVLVARPASVFICLAPFRISWREKLLLSWVGLRGAVPIILATYPLLAGIAQGDLFFNVVFFVVLVSVFVQGTSIPLVARWLRVDEALPARREYPLRYTPVDGLHSDLRELVIAPESPAVGRSIVQLRLPATLLVVLVSRAGEFIVPNGGTVLQAGDSLLVLSEMADYDAARMTLGAAEGTLPPVT